MQEDGRDKPVDLTATNIWSIIRTKLQKRLAFNLQKLALLIQAQSQLDNVHDKSNDKYQSCKR